MEEVTFHTNDFDEEFKKIEIETGSNKVRFYETHKEYMPFVGTDYKNSKLKILLVGESHYINNDWRITDKIWENYDLEKWVKNNWKEIFEPLNYEKEYQPEKDFSEWFNTRIHANRTEYPNKQEKAIKNLILNPLTVINQTLGLTFGIKDISFLNFFQYPSIYTGKTVWNSMKGTEHRKVWEELFTFSLSVVTRVVEIIKPDIVIFLGADLFYRENYIASEIKRIVPDWNGTICATYHSGDNRVWNRKYKNLNYKKPSEYLSDEIKKALQRLEII